MNVLQQAQVYVDQLRREAGKTRVNVSDSIHEMKVGHDQDFCLGLNLSIIMIIQILSNAMFRNM